MSESQDLVKRKEITDSVLVKTIRSTINLFTNVLMILTVLVCVLYVHSAEVMSLFHWHVILCVLGYQFFMNQGTLVLSRYNNWSIHLNRRSRKHLHIAFQLIGFVLVISGSSIIFYELPSHFDTTHGSLGLSAAISSCISILNGTAANYAHKLNRSYIISIKYLHYLSGILTLFLSAGSLSTGFEVHSFRVWLANDDAVTILMFVTWLFTMFVAVDFWIAATILLRNLL